MPHLFGLSWQWPATCEVCLRWPSAPVCSACLARHGNPRPRCPSCALPLAPGLERCQACNSRTDQPLAGCVARVAYQYPWADLVARFKFQGEPGWARTLADIMVADPAVLQVLGHCDLWAPIPLAHARLRERGYNQAWELTKALRRAHPPTSGTAAHPDVLVHTDTSRLQHTLDRAERVGHASLALKANPHPPATLVGRRVLLVDDVMTTGATLEAAARCLLAQGAASVHGLVFARTPATPLI